MKKLVCIAVALILALTLHEVHAAPVQTVFTTGLTQPTSMVFTPDGSRLYVAEQGGKIRTVLNGQLQATPFAQVTTQTQEESGLLGIEIDPAYATNGYVYVFYYQFVNNVIHEGRVSRFHANAANPNIADAGETILFTLPNVPGTGHVGGALHFGPDGKLYIGVGVGFPNSNSQNVTNLFGKILRLNADGSIPADNPISFTTSNGQASTVGINRAIYALGFRNPFTAAVEIFKIYVNDVGEASKEEVNDLIAGANYGWPNCEGSCSDSRFTNPIFEYSHLGSLAPAAITGGVFYFGSQLAPSGTYFYADEAQGWIRKLNDATNFAVIAAPLDLDVSPFNGNLYALTFTGSIYQYSPAPAVGGLTSLATLQEKVVECNSSINPWPLLIITLMFAVFAYWVGYVIGRQREE